MKVLQTNLSTAKSITGIGILAFSILIALIMNPARTLAASTNCNQYGTNTARVCFDPTTGFGPIVHVINKNSQLVWAGPAISSCRWEGIKEKYYVVRYDNVSSYTFGHSSEKLTFTTSTSISCSSNVTTVRVSQETMNYLRWYGNMNNVQSGRIVL
jgi:hypothetical protein